MLALNKFAKFPPRLLVLLERAVFQTAFANARQKNKPLVFQITLGGQKAVRSFQFGIGGLCFSFIKQTKNLKNMRTLNWGQRL